MPIVYVCDTNSLIDVYRHYPEIFRHLRKLVSKGIIKIPEGVYREIRRKSDALRKRVDRWAEKFSEFVIYFKHDRRLMNTLKEVEEKYGEEIKVGKRHYNGFWKSPSGKRAADGQVVAIGKVYGYTVVSDDRAVRLACMLENVPCIGWAEFVRQIKGPEQLSLF